MRSSLLAALALALQACSSAAFDVAGGDATVDGATDTANDAATDTETGGLVCGKAQHVCGDRCVDDDSPVTCGSSCTPCPVPPGLAHAAAVCKGGACGFECLPGFADCDGKAVNGCEAALDAPGSCGNCTTTCPSDKPLCVKVGADTRCDAGCPVGAPKRCVDSCVDPATNPNNCGDCGTICPGTAFGKATCTGGKCGILCEPGKHLCEGKCLDDLSADSCGTSCTPCPTVKNAGRTCNLGKCGFSCLAGYADCNGGTDGCETSLTAPTTCGSCSHKCTGTAICGGDVCRCPDPRANNSDPSNCGGCGYACPPWKPACINGLCT